MLKKADGYKEWQNEPVVEQISLFYACVEFLCHITDAPCPAKIDRCTHVYDHVTEESWLEPGHVHSHIRPDD